MTVQKISDNLYWVRFRFSRADGTTGRFSQKVKVATAREAAAFERQAYREALEPPAEKKPDGSLTVEEAWTRFWAEYVEVQNEPSERAWKERSWNKVWKPRLGRARLRDVTNAGVTSILHQLIKDGRSTKTANNHGARFRRFLRWCADPDGGNLLERAPRIPKIRIGGVPESPERPHYPPEDVLRLVLAAETPENALMIEFAALVGTRISEQIELRVRDFDLNAGAVTISRTVWQAKQSAPAYVKAPKGGHFDRVPLAPILIARLRKLIDGRGPDALVFPGPSGQRLTRWQMGGILERAARRANLSAYGWHALRHSFCSNLARAGVPIPTVSKLMRHHDITTTMRYVHVLERDLRDGSDALAKLYRGGGTAMGPTVPVDAESGSVVGPREIGAHEDDHDPVR
jgi:integrase